MPKNVNERIFTFVRALEHFAPHSAYMCIVEVSLRAALPQSWWPRAQLKPDD